jgi:hypothetical protein
LQCVQYLQHPERLRSLIFKVHDFVIIISTLYPDLVSPNYILVVAIVTIPALSHSKSITRVKLLHILWLALMCLSDDQAENCKKVLRTSSLQPLFALQIKNVQA